MSTVLTDDREILFRQVHPNFVVDGQLSSQPFQPTVKDEGKLSVDRSALTDAAGSFNLYISDGHKSVAVYGLTVGEFGAQQIACHSDPLAQSDSQTANAAHAFADYSPHSVNQQKIKAKRLKNMALSRGCLYPLA